MPITEQEVRDFVVKSCAIVGGHGLDYLSVAVQSRNSSKSYVSHASVRVDDRAPDDVASETWAHFDDVMQSAIAEGADKCVIKVLLYRAKQPGGSRVFRTELAPQASEEEDTAGVTSMAAALVATNKDLRVGIKEALQMVADSAGQGWEIAKALHADNIKLRDSLTEHRIALSIPDVPQKDEVKEIAAEGIRQLIGVMSAKAMMVAQSEAEEEEYQKQQRRAKEAKE